MALCHVDARGVGKTFVANHRFRQPFGGSDRCVIKMNKRSSRAAQRWWILLSFCGSVGCDRAVDLGTYIGGHARSTPSASASSAPPAMIHAEPSRPTTAASPAGVPSATPSYPVKAANSAPPATGGVAAVPATSDGERHSASPSAATGKLAEREAAQISARRAAEAGVSTKPTETPSASATPKPGGLRNTSVGGGAVSGGNVSNAARMIAGLRAPLRSCYASDPSSAPGSLRFSVALGASGAVASVSSARSGGLSDRLVACATSAVQRAQFAAPEGGKAVIAFPVTFSEQDPVPAKRTSL